MSKQSFKQELFEKKFIDSIKHVKHPRRTSLIILGFIELFILAFFILIIFINDATFLWNTNLAFMLATLICIIWAISRLGILESVRLKARNWRNKKVADQLKLRKNIKLTLEEYRATIKQQSWFGIQVGLGLNGIGFIITIILLYTI